METGTWGHWLVRVSGRLGVEADLIDARQAHAVMKLQHNKTDANDAELLAEIARTGFCRPVSVKSEAAQMDLLALKARQHLVRQRRDTDNALRGLLAHSATACPRGLRSSWTMCGRFCRRRRPVRDRYTNRRNK